VDMSQVAQILSGFLQQPVVIALTMDAIFITAGLWSS
jgi:hypothetical protein